MPACGSPHLPLTLACSSKSPSLALVALPPLDEEAIERPILYQSPGCDGLPKVSKKRSTMSAGQPATAPLSPSPPSSVLVFSGRVETIRILMGEPRTWWPSMRTLQSTPEGVTALERQWRVYVPSSWSVTVACTEVTGQTILTLAPPFTQRFPERSLVRSSTEQPSVGCNPTSPTSAPPPCSEDARLVDTGLEDAGRSTQLVAWKATPGITVRPKGEPGTA